MESKHEREHTKQNENSHIVPHALLVRRMRELTRIPARAALVVVEQTRYAVPAVVRIARVGRRVELEAVRVNRGQGEVDGGGGRSRFGGFGFGVGV
jgi:hypothetical protein